MVRGNGVLRSGISVHQPEGLVVKRVVARGFTGYGVFVDANDTRRGVLADPFRIEDVDVSDVVAQPPGSSNGRAEACIWIGNTGTVRRARVRRCGWSGLWTGTATHRATFDRIDVDDVRTGVYVEHFTHDSRFRRLRIGRDVRFGLSAEWASPDWDGRPASVGNVIEDSRFESSFVGVYLDEGTTRTTVRRSRFSGQEWAAIGIYRGVGNAHYGNAVSGLAPGARAFTEEHPSSVPGEAETAADDTAPVSVAHGSVLYFAANVVGATGFFAAALLLARALGPSGRGSVAFITVTAAVAPGSRRPGSATRPSSTPRSARGRGRTAREPGGVLAGDVAAGGDAGGGRRVAHRLRARRDRAASTSRSSPPRSSPRRSSTTTS